MTKLIAKLLCPALLFLAVSVHATDQDGQTISSSLAKLFQSTVISPPTFKIWSVKVIQLDDTADLFVSVASIPVASATEVCEVMLLAFRFNAASQSWSEKFRHQGMRRVERESNCNYTLDVNKFHRVSGGYLLPVEFLEIMSQLDRERSKLDKLITMGGYWEDGIAELTLANDGNTVDVTFIANRCNLTVGFTRDDSRNFVMGEDFENSRICID